MVSKEATWEENDLSIDYISGLPNKIIYDIFDYLSYDDIVRTSCLSKRWRHLCASTPHLDFNAEDMQSLTERNTKEGDDDMMPERRRRLVNSVNQVFSKRELPIEGFSLTFDPMKDEDHPDSVDRWICLLQSRKVECLGLEFAEDRYYLDAKSSPEYILPSQVFQMEFLANLALKYCRVQLPMEKLGCIALKSLKTLCLEHVFITDEDMNERILPNAPRLEQLALLHCHDLTRLEVPPELLSFKSLEVFDCFRIDEIKAEVPNLESFYYRGPLVMFYVNTAAPLSDVCLYLKSADADRRIPDRWFDGRPTHDLASALRILPLKLPYVKNLLLSIEAIKLMIPGRECIPEKLLSDYANLKSFTWSIGCVHELDFSYLMCILRSCPSLEKLTICFIELTRGASVKARYEHIFHESKKETWVHPNSIELGPIKDIIVRGFTAEKNQMELIRFLLNKCTATLESLTIEPSHNVNSWSKEVAAGYDIDDYYFKAQSDFLSKTLASPASRPRVVFLELDLAPRFNWLF